MIFLFWEDFFDCPKKLKITRGGKILKDDKQQMPKGNNESKKTSEKGKDTYWIEEEG